MIHGACIKDIHIILKDEMCHAERVDEEKTALGTVGECLVLVVCSSFRTDSMLKTTRGK